MSTTNEAIKKAQEKAAEEKKQREAAQAAAAQAVASGPGKAAAGMASSVDAAVQNQTADPMAALQAQQQAGLEQIEKAGEEAAKYAESEEKRQRMLEGRMNADDYRQMAEEADRPKGGYKSNGIVRFADSSGKWIYAVNGYFIPENEDEEKILKHYVKTGVVEEPKD